MNNIITLSQLITRLGETTGTDSNTCRRYLRALFASIEDALVEQHVVVVDGIGTFRLTEGAFGAPRGVAFIPDGELAKVINAPFSMFEPVSLAEGVDFSSVDDASPSVEVVSAAEPVVASISAPGHEPEVAPVAEEEETHIVTSISDVSVSSSEAGVDVDEEVIIPSWPEPEDEEDEDSVVSAEELVIPQVKKSVKEEIPAETASKKGFPWLIVGIIFLVFVIGGYLLAVYSTADLFPVDDDEESVEEVGVSPEPIIEEVSVDEVSAVSDKEIAPEVTETVANASAEVSAQPDVNVVDAAPVAVKSTSSVKTDTVTKKRFLATMAREYYGKGIYWVYIYEANLDRLDNPDKIKPGTVVVIPEKSSFAKATEKETLRHAEIKQAEIARRYK